MQDTHRLEDARLYHAFQHPSMPIFGSGQKQYLGLLSNFEPVKSILPPLQSDPHPPGMLVRLCEELFVGSDVLVVIGRSYRGGLDVLLRGPEDLPSMRWFHYSSRGALVDPRQWRAMAPVAFEGWLDSSDFTSFFAML